MALSGEITLRVQTPDGMKRLDIPSTATLKDLYEGVQKCLKLNDFKFEIFKERNLKNGLMSTRSQTIEGNGLKHGDIIYFKHLADESTRRGSVQASDTVKDFAPSAAGNISSNDFRSSSSRNNDINEDEVDIILAKTDGRIQRGRDSKLCRHNLNGCCVHCSAIEPYDEAYLKEQKIKHLSFHSYLRKQTSGADRGKFVPFDDINCRIKPGCRDHLPWPKGICSKCQPSAITLNRQIYRHVDNVMFENTSLVERFLNYWRTTGHQRMGILYGTYEQHADVPLGIRARVAAIYEPPQESTRDSIKLLDDEHAAEVDEVALALGLKRVGWIFTDLISEDAGAGTVKQIRGIETHFLTAQECILAGNLQNLNPNPCRYASNGVFGSKFVTVCVTGDKTKQVHMEGYAVSAQCMALVRDNCFIPTKDAPELGYIRESTETQYVPDVYYKEKDQYGNEVQRLARPLPVEYLLVDVPASTPLTPVYTFSSFDGKETFPVENRYIDGHLQDFNALISYLSKWNPEQFLEAISDFHVLLYLYKTDMLPMKANMNKLFDAVKTKDKTLAAEFQKTEVWATMETVIRASSSATGGTASYPGHSSSSSSTPASDNGAASTWTCIHCTFINPSALSACDMCGLPK